MNTVDFLRAEIHRREAYQLLSACYYLPEEDTLEKLTVLERTLGVACPEAVEPAAMMRDETDLEQLKVDFSRLFVGPFKLLAPPYGSVYLESGRQVMGASTVDAKNRYQEAGLDISGEVKEAPDHIALELEFMYYLVFKEIEVLEQSDLERVMDYLRKQQQFLERHLGAWMSKFAANVEQNATTDFYKSLAAITKLFVQKDIHRISEVLTAQLSTPTTSN